MQHGKNLHFIQFDAVKNPVRKTIEIQAADVGKTNGVKLRATLEFAVGAEEFLTELTAQTRKFVLIPIEGALQVSPYERMSFESGHRQFP